MMRAFSLAEAREWLQATLAGARTDAGELWFDGVSTELHSTHQIVEVKLCFSLVDISNMGVTDSEIVPNFVRKCH